MYTNHNYIKKKKSCTIWKWLPNNRFLSCVPEEVFNEFWFIVRQHEHIYFAEIEIGNFCCRVILGEKHFFFFFLPHGQKCLFMLISEKKDGVDLFVFSASKLTYLIVRQLEKNNGQKKRRRK